MAALFAGSARITASRSLRASSGLESAKFAEARRYRALVFAGSMVSTCQIWQLLRRYASWRILMLAEYGG